MPSRSSWLVALAWVALPLVAGAQERSPRINYTLHCQGCHLESGAGRPPDIPRLKHRVGYLLQIPDGREYLVQVPGVANAPIGDAELAGVLNYMVRQFAGRSMPPSFEPYTRDEVTRLRSEPPLEIDAIRHRLGAEVEARFGSSPPRIDATPD